MKERGEGEGEGEGCHLTVDNSSDIPWSRRLL